MYRYLLEFGTFRFVFVLLIMHLTLVLDGMVYVTRGKMVNVNLYILMTCVGATGTDLR